MPNEEVPLLSPCPATMLSKNFGGKFKYMNQNDSEFLAGHLNLKMQNAKYNRLSVKPFIATALFNILLSLYV